jgi:alpha-L-arabinofuranosidase
VIPRASLVWAIAVVSSACSEGALDAIDPPLAGKPMCTPAGGSAPLGTVKMRVNVAEPGHAIPATLYGAFLEEINNGGEGGIYGELISNRAFNAQASGTAAPSLDPWTLVTSRGAAGTMSLDATQPLNSVLAQSLNLTVSKVAEGGRVGIANPGYWGIAVTPGTSYTASIRAKAAPGFSGAVTVSLESVSGTVLAQSTISGVTSDWQEFTRGLTVGDMAGPTTNNRLVVSTSSVGTVWLDMVSLFPPTWKGRPNGLRPDVAEILASASPRFLRFPGGNYLQGSDVHTYFQWKNTIGDVAQRPGHYNSAWNYWVTDGLGIDEYLQLCEDLQAEPVLAMFAGDFFGGPVSQADMGPYVQDAVDEIEYALGDSSTVWGAKRIANGHPAPYNLTFVEIGNNDSIGAGNASYDAYRFPMFYDAIKAAFPQIQVIATEQVSSRTPDMVDDHYYVSASEMIQLSHQYDATSRTGPHVMVGEYAVMTGDIWTLDAAIAEAAAMAGFERNSDIVSMGSYAPLLVNDAHHNWDPDLIVLNAATVYGTPSYYVQKMFATHVGDTFLPTTVTGDGGALYVTSSMRRKDRSVFVKVANTSATAQSTAITLEGASCVSSAATASVLTSAAVSDTNSFASPAHVVPVESTVAGVGASFLFTFPANSVTALSLPDVH